jgi:hypothetical protein
MASKLRIAGLGVLIIGVLLLSLFNFLWVVFPPFGGRTQDETSVETIPGGFQEDVIIQDIPTNVMLFLSIKVVFMFDASGEYSCTVDVLLESNIYPQRAALTGTHRTYSGEDATDGYVRKEITGNVPAASLDGRSSIYLRINNLGSNQITIATRRIYVIYAFQGLILPGLIAVTGVILTGISFVIKREPKVKQPRAAPTGGWEPTLQWGGGAGKTKVKKKPKLAVSSTKGKPVQKRVVKKVAKPGATAACKFCGKEVPSNAFFCPHCYGKLR